MNKAEKSLIAKCGNAVKGNQHWRGSEDRLCRICMEEEETIKHVIEKCERTNGKGNF